MKRVKIIVNNKQVTRRYLGDKLIGVYYPFIRSYKQGEATDLEENEKFIYITAWTPGESFEDSEFNFERYVPKKITIGEFAISDGVIITQRESYVNGFKLTFKDLESKKRMLERLRKINEYLNFSDKEIKIYGVEV